MTTVFMTRMTSTLEECSRVYPSRMTVETSPFHHPPKTSPKPRPQLFDFSATVIGLRALPK